MYVVCGYTWYSIKLLDNISIIYTLLFSHQSRCLRQITKCSQNRIQQTLRSVLVSMVTWCFRLPPAWVPPFLSSLRACTNFFLKMLTMWCGKFKGRDLSSRKPLLFPVILNNKSIFYRHFYFFLPAFTCHTIFMLESLTVLSHFLRYKVCNASF